jgi:tryptophan synthase alpha chain
MSRIAKAFQQKAKIAYLTAGDGPSVEYFLALSRGGANILEIGIPFSDPIADGPVIQKAMERALNNRTNVESVLQIVRQIRSQSDAAIVLFSYFNPICLNIRGFLQRAKDAGADGILVVDLPYEESHLFRRECRRAQMAFIPIAAPSTPPDRISLLGLDSDGFLYYACRKGTTGAKESLPDNLKNSVSVIRQHVHLPVAIGFGIATLQAVRDVLKMADGCVVGSFFVSAVERGCQADELEMIAKEMFSC